MSTISVAILNENNIIKPNIPAGVDYEVVNYDLENSVASVIIRNNPDNLEIQEVA